MSIGVGGAGGNQDLLFYIGNDALRVADHVNDYFALQRRHPDGERWIEVGRFASREIAGIAMNALIAHGQGEAHELRVRHVRIGD